MGNRPADPLQGDHPEYTGTSGKKDNCQIGTFLAYVAPAGHALIDRHLYLPESWTQDRDRCRQAGIGEQVEFQTKPCVALDMLQRAIDADVPFTWFTADEAFGQVKYIRVWLEERDVFPVVATRCNDDVSAHDIGYGRADAIIAALPASAWKRMSCGDGAHGPRIYDWCAEGKRKRTSAAAAVVSVTWCHVDLSGRRSVHTAFPGDRKGNRHQKSDDDWYEEQQARARRHRHELTDADHGDTCGEGESR